MYYPGISSLKTHPEVGWDLMSVGCSLLSQGNKNQKLSLAEDRSQAPESGWSRRSRRPGSVTSQGLGFPAVAASGRFQLLSQQGCAWSTSCVFSGNPRSQWGSIPAQGPGAHSHLGATALVLEADCTHSPVVLTALCLSSRDSPEWRGPLALCKEGICLEIRIQFPAEIV